MKNVLFLSTLMLLFAVAGCNKDQKVVKTLDGKWQLSKLNGNAVPADEISQVTFSNCKLRKDEYCAVRVDITSFVGENISISGDFRVLDKGETIETRFTFDGEIVITRLTMKDLTKTKFVWEYTSDGFVYVDEYVKI